MTFKDRENAYRCQACQFTIRTVDLDDGVTPMFLACRRPGCPGMMVSGMYNLTEQILALPGFPPAVTHEWYKPTDAEVTAMPAAHQDHYRRGGLKLRERPAAVARPGSTT